MQLVFILLTVVLLAVAIFALQNATAVSVRFLRWEVESSVAMVTLGATSAGALMAGLVSLATRVRRWSRSRGSPSDTRPPIPSGPRPPTVG